MPTAFHITSLRHSPACPRTLEPARSVRPASQAGATAVEFAVVALPLCLAALGGIEIAHWFSVRQAVSLALLEAARAASVAHAKPTIIEHAFEAALLPLFAGKSKAQTRERMEQALQQRRDATLQAPWRIVIHSPGAAAYADFARPHIAVEGLATIDNDYQHEQDLRHRRRGWVDGKGPASQMTIFQANTLEMTLTYLHQPVLPGISGLLKQLYPASQPYTQAALKHGYLPMTRSLALIMQSHPVNWPSLPNGKVVHAHERSAAASPIASDTDTPGCPGAWCLSPQGAPGKAAGAGNEHTPALPGMNTAPHPDPASGHTAPAAPGNHQGASGNPPGSAGEQDALCGVTLCCD